MPWTTEARQKDNCFREGRTSLLLALVIQTLTTHPFRDGVQFLLPIRRPPTFGRSLRFFHVLNRNFFAHIISFLFRRLWPPSISYDIERFVAAI